MQVTNEITYRELRETFEKTHFKVINPVTYVQVIDGVVHTRTKGEMFTLYENLYYKTIEKKTKKDGTEVSETKQKTFLTDWMKDPYIRTYKELVFEPCNKISDDQYNLWNGWRASKLEKRNTNFEDSLMNKHFKYIFGDEMYEYAMDYFAHIVQTGKKTDVCLLLQSEPGTGKDTVFNYVGQKILGQEYYLNEDHVDMLIGGNFNEDISHKVLIVLNESNRAKTSEIIEAVKNAITRDFNSIRIKKEKTRFEKNNINWGTLTNSHDSMKIENNDRRIAARKIPSTYKGNTKYYDDLYDEIESGNYDRACYDFFMERKIKVKKFQAERPMTDYYQDLKERNIPVSAQFLVSIMQEETDELEMLKIPAKSFYDRYMLFLKQNGYEYKHTMTKFGLDMKQYDVVKKHNTKKCIVYTINIKELETYLRKERYYSVSDGSDDEIDTSPEVVVYLDPKDKASYVRAEEYNELKDELTKLQDEIRKVRESNVNLSRVTYEYDTTDESDDIPVMFQSNIFTNNIERVTVECKKSNKIVKAVKVRSDFPVKVPKEKRQKPKPMKYKTKKENVTCDDEDYEQIATIKF
jgi:DNA polymerase III delta prime subunit